jgi:hypothetical protein
MTVFVQTAGDLSVGASLQQFIDQLHDLRQRLSNESNRPGPIDSERLRLAAAPAHVNGDLRAADQRDVLDHQREHLLALHGSGPAIVPDAGEVLCEISNALACRLI